MRRTGGVSVSGAMLLVLLWSALVPLLSGPTWAQGAGAEGIPVGTPAAGQDTDNTNSPPDLIVVSANDCTVAADDSAVSITVEDGDGTSARFVDGQEAVTITAPGGRPQIQGPAADFIGESATFPSTDSSFDTDGDYTVASSEGVTCARTGGGQRVDDEEADPVDDVSKSADELANLGCDELLVLFRGESNSGQQYGDAAVFADSEVRAQVEVCLEREILEGTAADDDLPDTGGLSLLALAVLGVVSAAAGLSVIRGGRR
jgi:hypothetical protein